jgi:hypothetical protein
VATTATETALGGKIVQVLCMKGSAPSSDVTNQEHEYKK